MAYDSRFRLKLATLRSFDLDNVDPSLFTTILDATAIKSNGRQCHRCKSYEHLASSCPFSKAATLEENKKKETATAVAEKWYHMGSEGCNSFQQGNCRFQNCQRAHVCRQCRCPEPLYRCRFYYNH